MVRFILFAFLMTLLLQSAYGQRRENDYYRLETIVSAQAKTHSRDKRWRPDTKEVVLEVTGMTALDDDRLAVAIRKGEIWILSNLGGDPRNIEYSLFADALHDPMGLIYRDGTFYTAQRAELTAIRDTDGDGYADEYSNVASGWGVTGNYHEYTYGPKLDQQGNFWVTLNMGMGEHANNGDDLWRGWGIKIDGNGNLIPVCSGMRSPSGFGANSHGDMFFTDQQGNWIATCSLHHMREDSFFGHPWGLRSPHQAKLPTIEEVESVAAGVPWPNALPKITNLKPPAVWFPYKKVGQSATDVVLDNTTGKFGPFTGQLFIGEFRLSEINRVFLERVAGEYQGACFRFRSGFDSAVVRMDFNKDGQMYVGLTNRGWSSLGSSSYGLQRLVWTGRMPFEIKEMRAKPDGFELEFTKPVDQDTARNLKSYRMKNYTYLLQAKYGSPEILTEKNSIRDIRVSEDGLTVRLGIDGLREGFVHELNCINLKSNDGEPLLHPNGYYTLNRIPQVD